MQHYEAVLLTNCQQLTAICVVMSTCQIVHGQFGFTDVMSNMFWPGVPRPPPNYHYESRGYIERTYPRNSYRFMDYGEAMARGLLARQKKGNKKKMARGGGGRGGSGGGGDGGGDNGGGYDGDGDPVAGEDDGEAEGGGNPRTDDDDDNDIPTEKPHNDRRKRSFSAPPDVAGRVDGSDAMAVVLVAAGERARVAVAVPPDGDASGSDPTTAAFSRKSKSVLNKDANISYRRALKNIVENFLGASTDFNSSQLDNQNHVKKDFILVTENDSKINNNIVYLDKNDFKENKVHECADEDNNRDGDKNLFDADNSYNNNYNGGYGYNEDEDIEDDKDKTKEDRGYIDDSRNFFGYKSDHNYLENDEISMLTDTDKIQLKTFLKLTKEILPMFIMKTFGTELVQYVNSLKKILKELVIEIQKIFKSLVHTTMKFDRNEAEENIQKCIATTVNTMFLFIANALD